MAKQQSQPSPPDFGDEDLAQIKRYGQALGGVTPFDEAVEARLAMHERAREASATKMRAAQSSELPELGPTEALAKQQATLQQRAAASQQQAAEAQAAQSSVTPPPAPTGPAGVSQPYPAQRGEVGGAGQEQPGQEEAEQGEQGGQQ